MALLRVTDVNWRRVGLSVGFGFSSFVESNNIEYVVNLDDVEDKRILHDMEKLKQMDILELDRVFVFVDSMDKLYLVSNPYPSELKNADMPFYSVFDELVADEVRIYNKGKSIWNPGNTYMLVMVYYL